MKRRAIEKEICPAQVHWIGVPLASLSVAKCEHASLMPVCQSIGQHLLRLKWLLSLRMTQMTTLLSISLDYGQFSLFLRLLTQIYFPVTWQNHSWESFHSSFACASWGISLDYNSNSWSLCSVTTKSPVISDCPPIPLKESKQKNKKQTRLDCDRCLDDTVSARYRGVSGGTYRALSEYVEKRSEMEKQFWTFLQLIYLNYLICKPQTNRSVCLGRGAPGGVLQNVTTHRCLDITMTRQQGNQGMPAKLPRHISMRRIQNTGVSVVLSWRETEAVKKWKQTKVVSYICLSYLSWGLSEKA